MLVPYCSMDRPHTVLYKEIGEPLVPGEELLAFGLLWPERHIPLVLREAKQRVANDPVYLRGV